MKTHVTLAVAGLMATFLHPSNAQRGLKHEGSEPSQEALPVARVDVPDPSGGLSTKGGVPQTESLRKSVQFTVEFDECEGLKYEECIEIIKSIHQDNPAIFEHREHLNFNVQKKRQPGDPNYHRIGIMTNTAGTEVVGLKGDGIIKYSNPNFNGDSVWCKSDTPCPQDRNSILRIDDKCCFNVGPWDCDTGVPKSPDECCKMIKASVPGADLNGNKIRCHTVYPLSSKQHPVDYDRVQIRVDSEGYVLGFPVNN